ncbi:MAG: Mobile element protein, partial [Olavius algarvensis Gamma 1 endosymbiont]
SSTPRPPAPLWTAVYAATGLPTSRPCQGGRPQDAG